MSQSSSTLKSILQTTSLDKVDAKVLLSHLIEKHYQWPKSYLISHDQDLLTPAFLEEWKILESRRKQGEPVAYLLGSKPFHSIELIVNKHVLIPRPETELLVQHALCAIKSFFQAPNTLFSANQPLSIIDVGCGSGAIILSIANSLKEATFFPLIKWYASDISHNAIEVAKANAQNLGLDQFITFILSDYLDAFKDLSFGLILSNPPYIANDEPHLQQGDLRFEPSIALTDFADGLSAFRRISQEAYSLLIPQGFLMMEHGYDQANNIQNLLNQKGFVSIHTEKDYSGLDRVTICQKG